jgi:hypothetical protein
MQKIRTLFKKSTIDPSVVTREFNDNTDWVFGPNCEASRKYDGTSCAIINGKLYRRYDAKGHKKIPEGAIECQPGDLVTGHHPYWVPCDLTNPHNKYHIRALASQYPLPDGTYELCGPHIQGNPERLDVDILIPHGKDLITLDEISYDYIFDYLLIAGIEGIVFKNTVTGDMCKIRSKDFKMRRQTPII